jgi:hypothetical protein
MNEDQSNRTSFQDDGTGGRSSVAKREAQEDYCGHLARPRSAGRKRGLQVPLAELGDTKENVRSALNRATRKSGRDVATATDENFLYVWNVARLKLSEGPSKEKLLRKEL